MGFIAPASDAAAAARPEIAKTLGHRPVSDEGRPVPTIEVDALHGPLRQLPRPEAREEDRDQIPT